MKNYYKQKIQELSKMVYNMSNNFYYKDIRDIVRNFGRFCEFNYTYNKLAQLSDKYWDILSEYEQEVCTGCMDNAQSAYNSVFRDFKSKYKKCGQNTYHTESENFRTALEFAALVKFDYDFDLIEYLAKKDAEEEEKRAASLTGESFSFDGFLTDEEKMLLCE